MKIQNSELILSGEGRIYHLNIQKENIAPTIILVGDPQRVPVVSAHFDKVEFTAHKREFVTHTGYYQGKRISVISTGIGPDNIDIVLNELDALFNIDLERRVPKEEHTPLTFVRLGTSGSLQADIPVDSIVLSAYGLGMDNLLHSYKDSPKVREKAMEDAFIAHTQWYMDKGHPCIVQGSEALLEKLYSPEVFKGITATAPNPLIVDLIAKATNSDIHLSWGTWAVAMLVPGLAAMFLMPLVLYFFFPPEIKETPNASQFAKDKLQELGPMNRGEKIMLGIFAILLLLWAGIPAMIFGKAYAVNPTTTAFLGLSLLLLSGVLTWQDVLTEKGAWDTVTWFSALVMMATFLNKLGLIAWLSRLLESGIGGMGMGWVGAVTLLLLAYMYAHYIFASTTAHITAMLSAFYAAGLALGAPPMLYALLLASSSSIMMTLTHYATGTSPVIFGSGYTTLGEWWKAGFIMSVVNLAVFVVIGGVWWKVMGYW